MRRCCLARRRWRLRVPCSLLRSARRPSIRPFSPQGDGFIGADEIAAATGTINYEVMTSLGARVPKRHA